MLIIWLASVIRCIRRNCMLKPLFILILGFSFGLLLSDMHWQSFNIQTKFYRNNTNNNLYKIIDLGYHNHSNGILADKLYKEVNILCWVMTNPNNHHTRVPHIRRTWGKRCNKLLIMSSKDDKELGIIGLPVGEGRDNLWAKCKEAFKYIYKHHVNEYDWIFKADDDTYAVIENLRLLLYEYDPRTPIHFGYKFAKYMKQGYMSGGGGYALSNEALKRFIEVGLPNPKKCYPGDDRPDDVEIGRCFENVGVIAGDSRDLDKRGRFFIFPPESHLLTEIIDLKFWYWDYMYYKTFEGLNCCSDYTISFHYVSGAITDILDYLIYHAKPYGINMKPRKLPTKHKIYIQTKIP